MALLLAAVWLVAAEARAEPPPSEMTPVRTELVFGTIGIGAQAVHASLVALLRAELRGMSLSLIERQPAEPLSGWAREATGSGAVLVAILLDGRSEQGWRLVIIDAARGRAIVRALPGGLRDDAASIEAVASIAVSAASALQEGLEVASMPLAAVVGGAPTPSSPPAAADRHEKEQPVASKPRASWQARGQVGMSVATFSPTAPTMQGIAMALGLTFDERVEARAFGTAFLPTSIGGPLGDFRVTRTSVGIAAGPVLRSPMFSLAAEAGFVGERVGRHDATPAIGVVAAEPRALYRFGGVLALRLRRTLFRPLSVELVAGGLYFGRRLQFTAQSAESSWSETVWPAVAFTQLGLEIATN